MNQHTKVYIPTIGYVYERYYMIPPTKLRIFHNAERDVQYKYCVPSESQPDKFDSFPLPWSVTIQNWLNNQ